MDLLNSKKIKKQFQARTNGPDAQHSAKCKFFHVNAGSNTQGCVLVLTYKLQMIRYDWVHRKGSQSHLSGWDYDPEFVAYSIQTMKG